MLNVEKGGCCFVALKYTKKQPWPQRSSDECSDKETTVKLVSSYLPSRKKLNLLKHSRSIGERPDVLYFGLYASRRNGAPYRCTLNLCSRQKEAGNNQLEFGDCALSKSERKDGNQE